MSPELRGYLQAILFSEVAWWKVPPDSPNPPPLDTFYSLGDFTPDFLAEASDTVEAFLEANADMLQVANLERDTVGSCLWWSRNGHGAGFFDRARPWEPEALACDMLHAAAKALGHCDVSSDMFSDVSSSEGRRVRAVLLVSFWVDSPEAEREVLESLDGWAAHIDAELRDSGYVAHPSVDLSEVSGGFSSDPA